MSEKPTRVLFLCVGNACRSQMAEALLRHLGGARFEAFSAGSIPSGIFSMTIRALEEVGIDASAQFSKHWSIFLNAPPFDYIITLCEPEAKNCPIIPAGKGERLHWPFEDPASATGSDEERMAVFRRVRDQIAAKLCEFFNLEPMKKTSDGSA